MKPFRGYSEIFSALCFSVILLCLHPACSRTWEHDVVENGIRFKKITKPDNGNIIGFMAENSVVQGFPCEKGWIHFRKDWTLLAFQLSEECSYRGTLLPAHTWILLPHSEVRKGYACSFPFDYTVQGYTCRGTGGYKGVHTGFYDSGRLRSFYPSQNIDIDGVPCKKTLLFNVELHENGKLGRCRLSMDHIVNGKVYKKGSVIGFDESGAVR